MTNQIIHGDCFEVMKSLSDNSFDAVITDPPYGIGLSDWDSKIDVDLFTSEAKRLTTDFYVFFGQMPTVINWINACKPLHYLEHISWVKRMAAPTGRLSRSHESIYIYTKNKKYFYTKKGKYEDVKLPGILVDVISIESYQRRIADLLGVARGTANGISRNGQSRQKDFKQKMPPQSFIRSPEEVNFTNVWSFLPTTHAKRFNHVKYQHPTQKPIEIMKRLIEMCSPPGGTILDPFGGSGTTAIACLETGRNYVIIEQSLEYFTMINERVADWHESKKTEQLELF
jgi:site-specific DNA-methyltransferase (adenine-specific)